MARNVFIQPTAARELEAIVAYRSSFGPSAAAAFLDEWDRMLESLRDGAVCHALSRFDVLARLGYRAVLLEEYVVLHFEEGSDVVVAHVFHQRQDYASLVMRRGG